MANNYPVIHFRGVLTSTILTLTLLVSTPCVVEASSPTPKYKKHSVVDFDEALVEGKSRKPYSAYLYKQQEQRLQDLSTWTLDLSKKFEYSSAQLGE